MKKRYFAIPILAIALHFLLSNLLYFLVERFVLDVFHISPQQFMNYSYWGEILIYAVLILVFFTLYKLLWRKEISEPRTATNFKDVLGSLVVGFGICGISGLWIMLAEQLPSLQKSVEAMNAGAENIAGGNAFGTFMIAVIAAPIVEEILFRGIVLRSMRKFTPAWAAILGFLSIAVILLRRHEDQMMPVRFEGVALIECDIPSGTVFQQLFLQTICVPVPTA